MTIVNPTIVTPERVVEIMHKAHDGQTDLAGAPYANHPIRVANSMVQPRHQMIALLHDVVEDSDWTFDDLFREGVPLDALATLRLLTHTKGQPYEEYIDAMGDDVDAIVVKMGDLRDNMDVTRLPELGEREIKRLKKYHKAYYRLLFILGTHMTQEAANDGTEH